MKVLILFSWLMLRTASVDAQTGSILLVSHADVPAGVERSVKRKLGQVADVSTASPTNNSAAPGSDAAFSRLAERASAALIVHLRMSQQTEDKALRVELRQAGTGAVLSTHDFAMQAGRRFKQPTRALRELVVAAREQLSKGGVAMASAREGEDEGAELAEQEPDASESAQAAPLEPAPGPQPEGTQAAPDEHAEQVMDDPELSARLAASTPELDAGPPQGLGLQASVGLGPGVHALRVPMPAAADTYGQLDTGLAPAASLSAAAQFGLGPWLLRAEAQYRTFLGIEPAPVPTEMSGMSGVKAQSSGSALSSHSFVIGASPGYRFGGRDSVAVLVMLGWTYRSLHAAVTTLPGVSLTGFVARPALLIPFGDGVFCLRLAPELVLVRSSETNAQGFMPTQASGGIGWGAEAALDVRLAKLFGAGLQYRRSRIRAARSSGAPAIDEEWYVAVQAVLSL